MNKTAVASAENCLSVQSSDLGHDYARKHLLLTRLTDHIADNDAEGIRALLAHNRDVVMALMALQESAYAALFHAAALGKSDALYTVLEKLPADVLSLRRPKDGRTLLMLAAHNGHARIIVNHHRVLREKQRDLFLTTGHALSHYVPAHTDKADGRELRLEDFGRQWLTTVNARDQAGNTPLLIAVKRGHYLCARILLMFSADPHIPNTTNESAFTIASHPDCAIDLRDLVLSHASPQAPGHDR